jgi:hypothetical protein
MYWTGVKNVTHNVFLSWSGERSRLVAEFLRDWLSQVIQAAKPWMSDSEVQKGSRSLEEIGRALADIKVGILCLTPENQDRPWLLYEAGCLSKSIDERTRLCTYLIGGLQPSDVRPPLGMFQATRATKEDTLSLLRTINSVVGDDPLSDQNLVAIFEAMWPKLDARLSSLPAPSEVVPARRPPEDVMNEILELARAQASYREKTKFMDTYIPTFQQLLPLLQQVIAQATRRGAANRPVLGHPAETSLARSPGAPSFVNTFSFPVELKNAMPIDPSHRRRSLDLVQMFGGTQASADAPHATLRLFVRGIELATGNDATYEIDFALEVPTARKIARYLADMADDAERHQIRFTSENIKAIHDVRETLANANKDSSTDL